MNDFKEWYKSRTIIGTLIALVAALLSMFKVIDLDASDQGFLTDNVLTITTGSGALFGCVLAIYGRIKAKTSIKSGATKSTGLGAVLLAFIILPAGQAWAFFGAPAPLGWLDILTRTFTPLGIAVFWALIIFTLFILLWKGPISKWLIYPGRPTRDVVEKAPTAGPGIYAGCWVLAFALILSACVGG